MAFLGIDAATNQAVCNIRPDPSRAYPRYVFHCLQSKINHFLSRAEGGAQPNISQGIIKETKIPLPPLDEQRRIAAILDKADALRRKRKRGLELLDSLSQSIFLEMFGDLNRYQAIAFGQSLTKPLRNGLSPSKAGTFPGKVLTLSAITGGMFKPSAGKEAMFANEPPANQRIERGEFLICRGNGNKSLVGVGVFASHSMPDTLFPDTIIAGRIDPKKFDPRFFQDVWNGDWVRNQIEKSARTTNGTFKVNQSGLESLDIPMPDIALQKAYGEKVTLVQQAKIVAQNQINFLNFLFASLQQRAFCSQL
jgi:type I restriction enzyme S subunit